MCIRCEALSRLADEAHDDVLEIEESLKKTFLALTHAEMVCKHLSDKVDLSNLHRTTHITEDDEALDRDYINAQRLLYDLKLEHYTIDKLHKLAVSDWEATVVTASQEIRECKRAAALGIDRFVHSL